MWFLRSLFQQDTSDEEKYRVILAIVWGLQKISKRLVMYAKGVTSENKFLRYLEKRTLWRIPNSACEMHSQAQDNLLPCPWGLLSGPLHYAPPPLWVRRTFCLLFSQLLSCTWFSLLAASRSPAKGELRCHLQQGALPDSPSLSLQPEAVSSSELSVPCKCLFL